MCGGARRAVARAGRGAPDGPARIPLVRAQPRAPHRAAARAMTKRYIARRRRQPLIVVFAHTPPPRHATRRDADARGRQLARRRRRAKTPKPQNLEICYDKIDAISI